VARDASDVLAALELACAGRTRSGLMDSAAAVRARSAAADEGVPAGLSAAETAVLGALEETAVSFELVSRRSGLTLAATAVALERLASSGLAARSGSGWERRARGRH
jgi:hypothetical protein